jgi:hypothetical protein
LGNWVIGYWGEMNFLFVSTKKIAGYINNVPRNFFTR